MNKPRLTARVRAGLALACDMAAIVTTCDWDEASRRRSAMSGRERESLERAIEWADDWKRYDRWRTIGGAALAAEEGGAK